MKKVATDEVFVAKISLIAPDGERIEAGQILGKIGGRPYLNESLIFDWVKLGYGHWVDRQAAEASWEHSHKKLAVETPESVIHSVTFTPPSTSKKKA